MKPNITYASSPALRVLSFGPIAAGKTRAPLTAAMAFPEQNFYMLSPQAGEALIVEELGIANVTVLPVAGWADVRLWMLGESKLVSYDKPRVSYKNTGWAGLKQVLKPGDWVIMDMMSDMTSMLRDYYADTHFHKTYAELLLLLPENKNTLQVWDHQGDREGWSNITLLADEAWRWLFQVYGVNVFITAQSKEVAMKSDGSPLFGTEPEFVALGHEPVRIHKSISYGVDLMLYMEKRGEKYYSRFVAKGRGKMPKDRWEVGPSFWHSFCAILGRDPKIAPGV